MLSSQWRERSQKLELLLPKANLGAKGFFFVKALFKLDSPASLREMYEALQSLILKLHEKLPEYEITELELLALSAIMSGLDPHSVVLPPSNYAEFSENTEVDLPAWESSLEFGKSN